MKEHTSGSLQPRLALEAETVAAEVAVSSDRPMHVMLIIARLEASEHLPCCEEDLHMSPEQVRHLCPCHVLVECVPALRLARGAKSEVLHILIVRYPRCWCAAVAAKLACM